MDKRAETVQNVTQQLRILFRAVQAHSKFVEKACGLSSAKLWMLYEIYNNPGLKVSQLAAALTIHPSTCSNMLDKLEEKGLLSRDRGKQDQRAVHLYLTGKGEELLSKAPQPAQGELSRALDRLDETRLGQLEDGLNGLVQVLTSKDESAGLVPIPSE
jgi:DNA-binding MarR family transcriptional regulator